MKYSLVLAFLVVSAFSLLQAQGSLTLALPQVTAQSGETVCVPVTVADFNGVLSFQGSIAFDANALRYQGVRAFGLPGLSRNNFGAHKAEEGSLTFLWFDQQLAGMNRPDGYTLFELCFEVVGSRGTAAHLTFTDGPTPVEILNSRERKLDLNPVQGKVLIQ